MPYMEFESDPNKAKSNLQKHGIDFEDAAKVFHDPMRIEDVDDRFPYGEDRYIAIGDVQGCILYVAFTYHEDRIRLISARKATRREQERYASLQA